MVYDLELGARDMIFVCNISLAMIFICATLFIYNVLVYPVSNISQFRAVVSLTRVPDTETDT